MLKYLLIIVISLAYLPLKAEESGDFFKIENLSELLKAELLIKFEDKGIEEIPSFELSNLKFSRSIKDNEKERFFPIKILEVSANKNNKQFILKEVSLPNKKNEFTAFLLDTEDAQITIRGKIISTKQVAVIIKDMNKGQIVNKEDVEIKHLPENRIKNQKVITKEQIVGKTLSRAIKKDSVITSSYFEDRNSLLAFQKGDIIKGVYAANNIFISTKLEVLQRAKIGDIISAKNIDSGKVIKVRLMENGTGLVNFSENVALNN
jgi:flagella basal body P-ring formation protein FlgA